jgi:hypothetical protein
VGGNWTQDTVEKDVQHSVGEAVRVNLQLKKLTTDFANAVIPEPATLVLLMFVAAG